MNHIHFCAEAPKPKENIIIETKGDGENLKAVIKEASGSTRDCSTDEEKKVGKAFEDIIIFIRDLNNIFDTYNKFLLKDMRNYSFFNTKGEIDGEKLLEFCEQELKKEKIEQDEKESLEKAIRILKNKELIKAHTDIQHEVEKSIKEFLKSIKKTKELLIRNSNSNLRYDFIKKLENDTNLIDIISLRSKLDNATGDAKKAKETKLETTEKKIKKSLKDEYNLDEEVINEIIELFSNLGVLKTKLQSLLIDNISKKCPEQGMLPKLCKKNSISITYQNKTYTFDLSKSYIYLNYFFSSKYNKKLSSELMSCLVREESSDTWKFVGIGAIVISAILGYLLYSSECEKSKENKPESLVKNNSMAENPIEREQNKTIEEDEADEQLN